MVRQPIVNGTVSWNAFYVSIAFTLVIWALAVLLLGIYRRKVALIV